MIVNFNNVSWHRNGSYILKNINWKVKTGEHWAIIGLNGSGKTSLLKIITGYTFPSEGDVEVLDKKFGSFDLRELRKSIGWVSSSLQEALYVNETAEDIVLSGKFGSIGLYDSTEKEDIILVKNLLKEFDCAELGKRTYSNLSQGEKQKIILARALMSKPELLILDEPCTGLDIFARENFLLNVERIGSMKNAPTLLYVTHHIDEILPVFNHTLLMRNGNIYIQGRKKEVLTEASLKDFFNKPVRLEWKNDRPVLSINLN